MAIVSEFDVEAEFDALTEHKPWPQVMAELIRKYPFGAAGAGVVIVSLFFTASITVIFW